MIIFKAFGVVLNVLFNPIVNVVKRRIARHYHPWIEAFFYHFGRYAYRIHSRIQTIAATSQETVYNRVKEMERYKTTEYGTEVFFEYFFPISFAVILGIRRHKKAKTAARAKKEKEREVHQKVQDIHQDLLVLKKNIDKNKHELKGKEIGLTTEYEKIVSESKTLESKITDIRKWMKKSRGI